MLDTVHPVRLLVSAPRSRQGGGPCWWSCRSWSSGTKPFWPWCRTAGRSPRLPHASASHDKACTRGSHAMRRAGSPRSPTGRIARAPVPTRSIPRPRPRSASCVGSTRGADRGGSVTSSRSSAWPTSPSGRPPAACARPKYAYIVAPARARPDVFGKREGRRTGVEVAGALVSGSGFAGARAVHGEP